MQTVSETGQQHTGMLLETLRPLTQEDTLGPGEGSPDISSLLLNTNPQSVSEEISRLHDCVVKSRERASDSVSQLLESAGLLATELGKACEIAANSACLQTWSDDLLRGFEVELENLGYRAVRGLQSAAQDNVAELATLYSMQSERELHRQVIGGGELVAASGAPVVAADNELGEGIDLF